MPSHPPRPGHSPTAYDGHVDNFWIAALWSILPTVVVSIVFVFVLRGILRFDMRAPGKTRPEIQRMYAAALDMAEYADKNGFEICVVSEHHGSPDNYLSSPLVLGGGIAARTSSIMISVQALLVPQHNPVRLAEDLAILDHISKGRITYTTGLGYRPIEYHMLDRDWKRRGRIFSVTFDGKEYFPRYEFNAAYQPLPLIKEVLATFGTVADTWKIAAWFHYPNGRIVESRPGGVVKAIAPKDALDRRDDLMKALEARTGSYVA